MNIQIFCTYFYSAVPMATEPDGLIIPIQGGAEGALHRLPMIGDDTGDNISARNDRYGELTVMYWVWKNYLPTSKHLAQIGFFQYRRLLDLNFPPGTPERLPACGSVFQRVEPEDYQRFVRANRAADLNRLRGYDLIVAPEHRPPHGPQTMEEQYRLWHPGRDLDVAAAIIRERYPQMADLMAKTLARTTFRFTLVLIIRREIFLDFMPWLFDVLFEVERRSDWREYTEYHQRRLPAFLAERLLNIWIDYKRETSGLTILERPGYLLHGVKPDEPFPVRAPEPISAG